MKVLTCNIIKFKLRDGGYELRLKLPAFATSDLDYKWENTHRGQLVLYLNNPCVIIEKTTEVVKIVPIKISSQIMDYLGGRKYQPFQFSKPTSKRRL